jgi:parvulin-like peptidyl-prolyl isomerase
MRRLVFLLILSFLMVTGCGEKKEGFTEKELNRIPPPLKKTLPPASGGYVLAVGGDTITADQVAGEIAEHFKELAKQTDFEQFNKYAAPQIDRFLISKISNILLYQEAKKGAKENIDEALDKEADKKVREFIVNFGGDYAMAEEELKRMGMDWKSFKDSQKKIMLSQSYVASLMPENQSLTYTELRQEYEKMKDVFNVPASLQFSLIDIMPEKLELTDPNENRLEKAQQLSQKIVNRLNIGENFASLAKQYSHDHMASAGGLWNPVNPSSLAEPYDILATEAQKINPGQIAGPINTRGHIFIMKLENKQAASSVPFEDVQNQIEAKIMFERRKRAADELGAKLAQQATLGDRTAFVNYCSRKTYDLARKP